MQGVTLSELFKKMIEMGGSDLHISTNSPPRVRVHGKLRPLDMPPLTASDTKSLAYSVLTDSRGTQGIRLARTACRGEGSLRQAARIGARDRADRLRQIDHPGRHARQ